MRLPELEKQMNDKIIDKLLSGDPLSCSLAIRKCVELDIRDKYILSLIWNLQKSDMVEWNFCKVSDCAIAALHLLDEQEYFGDDPLIKEYIETVFYTKNNIEA